MRRGRQVLVEEWVTLLLTAVKRAGADRMLHYVVKNVARELHAQ